MPWAALFLSSGLYRRLWNFTKSARRAAFAFVGFTTGGEFHPALKILIQLR